MITIQYKFKFNFRKVVEKVGSIWGKFSRKEYLFWQGFHQRKHNHNSLFECQVYYKYETMKNALSSSRNLNKYKSQDKQWIVLQRETSYSNIAWFQTKSTAKNTRQVLRNKPNKYLPFLNPKSTARTIKENFKLHIEVCFER